MSGDRDRIAESLHRRLGGARYQWDETADVLLPVVDRIANERAAAALRAVADRCADRGAQAILRKRADALDGKP